MKRVLISKVCKGEKFYLFASDSDDDSFVRGPYLRSERRYLCFSRRGICFRIHPSLRVYISESN